MKLHIYIAMIFHVFSVKKNEVSREVLRANRIISLYNNSNPLLLSGLNKEGFFFLRLLQKTSKTKEDPIKTNQLSLLSFIIYNILTIPLPINEFFKVVPKGYFSFFWGLINKAQNRPYKEVLDVKNKDTYSQESLKENFLFLQVSDKISQIREAYIKKNMISLFVRFLYVKTKDESSQEDLNKENFLFLQIADKISKIKEESVRKNVLNVLSNMIYVVLKRLILSKKICQIESLANEEKEELPKLATDNTKTSSFLFNKCVSSHNPYSFFSSKTYRVVIDEEGNMKKITHLNQIGDQETLSNSSNDISFEQTPNEAYLEQTPNEASFEDVSHLKKSL
ncbi:hypothetical protein [Alphaproteobacteria bacterium endosymbiont of Tiliacea citrago]|uniref:hypothetical protein n=1 Tax=Alphaproteobacteria bacterium endosymbiont of Tiliacea citrago TaxID=3077944 RepID=UPI00313DA21D